MLLALDTSTDQIGVALGEGERLLAEWIWYSQQYHTVELAPAVAELLKRAGAEMKDLEVVAVAIGPGSYTALRVGLALAKGLAVSGGIPLVGVGTLDLLAACQPACGLPLAAVLRAGRGRIALGWYRTWSGGRGTGAKGAMDSPGAWEAEGAAVVTTVDALAKSIDQPTLIAGELMPDERQRLARKKVNVVLAAPNRCVRRPSVLAEIGWVRFQRGEVDELTSLSPIYLHRAESHNA